MKQLLPIFLVLLLSACAFEQSYPTQDTSYTPTTSYKPQKLAGQCVGISKTNVDTMKALPLQGRRYLHFCKICNDKKPLGPFTIPSVNYVRVDDSNWTFNFGSGTYALDAADTYIESKANQFLNLSKLIDCPASNIQNEITMKSKKK